jgi:DNA-binding GntR family transcriptional regulator
VSRSEQCFVDGDERPDSFELLYRRLREGVLHGELAPGSVVSQVQLARRYNVSRAPLREALRMLQSEGLVEAQRGRRSRIALVSATDLDQVYAQRITLEALAVRLASPRMSAADIEELRALLAEMDEIAATRDFARWDVPHRRFHRSLVSGAGERLDATMRDLADHAERYRRILLEQPRAWSAVAVEHRGIVDAVEAGDHREAASRLAAHYATTALTVCATLAPDYEPARVREALRFVQEAAQTTSSGGRRGT